MTELVTSGGNALPSFGEQPEFGAAARSSGTPAIAVVVPTRNEARNVESLHARLAAALGDRSWELLFVDDSDDETPRLIAELSARDCRVRTVHRKPGQRAGGLGGAVIQGFAASRAQTVVVMDGDLQHPPEVVPDLVAALDGECDLAVASRRTAAGSADGLSGPFRRLASRTCEAGARALLPEARATSDPMSGFFAVRRHVLQDALLEPQGYKILLEILVKGHWRVCRDVPFAFAPRTAGESKSDLAEARRFVRHVRKLRQDRAQLSVVPSPVETQDAAPTGSVVDRPLRIMIFTSEAAPVVSGISTVVTNLDRALSARGHHVDVVSRADFPRFVRRELRLSAFALAWPRFRRRLDSYDVINVHGPVPTMSEMFLLLSRTLPNRTRPKIVYTHHSDVAIPGLGLLCRPYNRLTQWLARLADVVLVSTPSYAEKFDHLEDVPVEVVPWGDDTTGKIRPRREEERDELRVLFVGQLRPYKGVHVLLNALRDLSHVSLTVIGDGPDRQALEASAREWGLTNVRFRGRVDDDELWRAYSEHDVIALPSLTSAEAYGLVLAEGMAAGCVPLASDLPGVREVAGPTGVLVDPGSAADIRNRLIELQQDRPRLQSLARASEEFARGLTVDATGQRHEEIFLRTVMAKRDMVA